MQAAAVGGCVSVEQWAYGAWQVPAADTRAACCTMMNDGCLQVAAGGCSKEDVVVTTAVGRARQNRINK